jgi:hypothetical protein
VLCFNDCVARKNIALNILGVRLAQTQ